jgi:thiol-disulfide isomerase/thioredoxin
MAGCGTRPPVASVHAEAPSLREALPFIHDDYPRALAEAKRTGRPLFVDAWAPWCHSCLSLRAHVLTDPVLSPLADSFVWLSVDTERDVNAAWVTRYPHAALPTLWVVDPTTERPLLKWAGTATALELRDLLMAARSDFGPRATGAHAEAMAAFVRGNRAFAEGKVDDALREHRAALAALPAEGNGGQHGRDRARILEALVTELVFSKKFAEAAELAAAEVARMPGGTSRATVLVSGLSAAREANLREVTSHLLDETVRTARARDASLLADDRSALYEEAVEAMKAGGDAAGARTLAREWASFLDAEATAAKNPDARASLDPLRVNAALALGEPARAILPLEQSAKDFPDDYNPHARLARVYLELGRHADADVAIDQAISRVYGPRVLRVLALKADIAKARGDRAAEAAALELALSRTERAVLNEGQRTLRESLAARLSRLRAE